MKNKFKQILGQISSRVEHGFRRTQKIYPVELFESKEFLNQKHIFFVSCIRVSLQKHSETNIYLFYKKKS